MDSFENLNPDLYISNLSLQFSKFCKINLLQLVMPSNTTHQAYKEKLHDKFDDLKQAFLSKANENQLIGNHLITRVLDFWGEILSIDVTEAKYWFREGNSKLPDEIEMQY